MIDILDPPIDVLSLVRVILRTVEEQDMLAMNLYARI